MQVKDHLEALKISARKLEGVLKLFPDIEEHHDRWNTMRLCTPSINKLTDDVNINHNCGCCIDSPLQVWPYKNVQGTEIHSKPTCFTIGEQNAYGHGERSDPNWQEQLNKANIPQEVIDKVQVYLDEHPPTEYDDEEDDYED